MPKEKKTTKKKVEKAVETVKKAVTKKKAAPKKSEKKEEVKSFVRGVEVLNSQEVKVNGAKKVKALLSNHTFVLVNEDEIKSGK